MAGCGSSNVISARPSGSARTNPGAGLWRWRICAETRTGESGASIEIQFTPDAVKRVRSSAARGPTVTVPPSASNLQHVQRRRRRHAEALALTDGEAMDAAVRAELRRRSSTIGAGARDGRCASAPRTTRSRRRERSRSPGCRACRRRSAPAAAPASRTSDLVRSPTGKTARAS